MRTFALYTLWSTSATCTSLAPLTTCQLVTMWPWSSHTYPEPVPCCRRVGSQAELGSCTPSRMEARKLT